MKWYNWSRLKQRSLVAGLLALLVVSVACGAAAKPAAPAAAPQKEAPVAKATAVPAATPAPTPTPAAAFSPGKVTMMQTVWGTQAFEQRYTLGLGETTYMRALHAVLIEGNHETQLIPGIATKWEVSSDGKTWTLAIGKKAKFHNGDDVTTEDVLFTMERYHGKEAETGATSTGAIQWSKDTEKAEIAGPDTIKVTHKKPLSIYPFAFSALQSSSAAGSILPKKYFEQVGGEKGYANKPLGAGPFKLIDFKRSEQLLFERFGDYYFRPANGYPEDRIMKFKTLDMRLVPEEATRVAALQAGEADVIEVTLQSRKRVEGAGGRLVWLEEASYTQVRPIGCWKPQLPCNKKQVRYALDYAIDRNLIVNQLYGGLDAARPSGMEAVTPHALGYSPELGATPYDPEKARQLLAEAGYPGGKGYPPFTLYTWQASDTPLMVEQAQLIADMWRKNLGLQVTVEVGDNVRVRERVRNRELDGQVYFRSNEGRWDGGNLAQSLHYLGSSLRQSEDPDLVKAVDEALAVMDPAKRHEAYVKMYKKSWEERWAWSTIYTNLPIGISSRIKTFQPWPLAPYPTALWTLTLK